ncbi:mechanosensitive ion channel family protein [Spiractinospora alimapuensis]|nr:mechanosensitive ion channel family protein [Spiractinospora alimapuensis]
MAELTQLAQPDSWLANYGDYLTVGVRIVVILVLAGLLRAILGRVITRLVKHVVDSREKLGNSTFGKLAGGNGTPAAARRQARAGTLGSVLRNLASIVIYGVAIVMVLSEVGISIGPILASAGVLGLAIGFGAQGLVQDFLAGMFILVEDQYGVGDVVDVGEAVGTVEEVGLRVTKIRDLNGGLWHVRNGQILRVGNMSQDWANAVVDIPLAATVDVREASAVLAEASGTYSEVASAPEELLEPPTVNGVVSITNGVLTIRVIAKTRPGSQWAQGRELLAHLKQALDTHNIELARPVMTSPQG